MKRFWEHPSTPANRKTPRAYGRIRQFILRRLNNGRIVSCYDLRPLDTRRALMNLHRMVQDGQIRLFRPGKMGRPGKASQRHPALFCK
jgi:hypothetical protein